MRHAPWPCLPRDFLNVGADAQGTSGARYQRPYAVPERLDLLQGPSSGTVHLPSYLDWSGNAVYDLDAPGRVVHLYRAVLIEAASPQDLYAYLDERVLRRLWALLWLPASSAGRGSRGSRSWPRLAASPRPRNRLAMEPRHERIARIALAAGGRYGLALA
jgi:hypothetical protein